MAAGWRDYFGFLPFVRHRTPPAPVQPSVNLLTWSVREEKLSLTHSTSDLLLLTWSIDGTDRLNNTSPLRRLT